MKMFLKYLLLFVLFMGLQIPLSMTQSLVSERTHFRDEAYTAVARMQGTEQVLVTPLVTVPYEQKYWEESRDSHGAIQRLRKSVVGKVSFTPSQLTVEQTQQVETREKGIYRVPIYTANIHLKGQFQFNQTIQDTNDDDRQMIWGTPILSMPMSEPTGIKSLSMLKWATQEWRFEPGSQLELESGRGVHVELPPITKGTMPFEMSVSVRGTRSLSVLPIAEKADISLVSNWPHAQFIGAQLPDERQISDKGFNARWHSHALANNLPNIWQSCIAGKRCDELLQSSVGVQLIDPVDIYHQVERAIKYGFLFVAVTFAAFILYEVLYQLKIHPMQYALVGLALTVFFMLLLSLAEQLGFDAAYGIAALACLVLLSAYMKSALGSIAKWAAFLATIAMLYAALYVILQLEDYALLAGSLFTFSMLGLAMWLTRRVDWYQVQQNLQSKDKTPFFSSPVMTPEASQETASEKNPRA